MITLEKVNKYFNRRKRNEIHIINNTSLQFEDTGLVALLGASGSRKNYFIKCHWWTRQSKQRKNLY